MSSREDSTIRKDQTEPFGSEAEEYGGEVSVNIVPDAIFGKKAFIIRADANEQGRCHSARTMLELATDVRMRDHFHLNEGDMVEIETCRTPTME